VTAGAPMPPDDEAINFLRDLLGAPHLDLNKYMDQMMQQQPINTVGGAKATMQEDKSDQIEQQQENGGGSGGGVQKRRKDIDMEKTIRELKKVIGSTAGDYIDDFVHSGNKKFKGKSKQERINMALAAYYGKAYDDEEIEKIGWTDEARAAAAEAKKNNQVKYHGREGRRVSGKYQMVHVVSVGPENNSKTYEVQASTKEKAIDQALERHFTKVQKVVPYAEAEPYRDEDDSITPTAVNHPSARMTSYEGAAANDAKPSGPSARSVHEGRAEASATGGKSDPTSDALVPGSGLKTRGRRRVV